MKEVWVWYGQLGHMAMRHRDKFLHAWSSDTVQAALRMVLWILETYPAIYKPLHFRT